MYLGFLLLLAAWAVWLTHPLALLTVPVFVGYMNRFQIRPEEAALTARFGEEFIAYTRRVRRWV
jgi:protein-S-isoprenylcysteine O-methyltransferase Ste14